MNRFPLSPLFLGLVLLATAAPCGAQSASAAPKSDAAHAATVASSTVQAAQAAQAAAPAAAQDAAERDAIRQEALIAAVRQRELASREPPVLDAADVSVRLVRPGNGRAQQLAELLQRQAQRKFYVRAEDGSVSGPYVNIDNFGDDVVMLHDRTALMPALEEALGQAVIASAQPDNTVVPLKTIEYRPRAESVANLLRALEPFARRISNGGSQGSGGFGAGSVVVSNVTALQDAGLLVLRDTEAGLAEMTALLARLDVPPPQVMLTCLLVQDGPAGNGDEAAEHLPDGLAQDLRQLLPVTALHRAGQAALRVAVVPGREVVLTGTLTTGAGFELKLTPTGYDRERGTLAVTGCALKLNGDSLFDTGAVLTAGENTVLGASGTEPLFVVLRVAPLGG